MNSCGFSPLPVNWVLLSPIPGSAGPLDSAESWQGWFGPRVSAEFFRALFDPLDSAESLSEVKTWSPGWLIASLLAWYEGISPLVALSLLDPKAKSPHDLESLFKPGLPGLELGPSVLCFATTDSGLQPEDVEWLLKSPEPGEWRESRLRGIVVVASEARLS